jgi:hypothetical protein
LHSKVDFVNGQMKTHGNPIPIQRLPRAGRVPSDHLEVTDGNATLVRRVDRAADRRVYGYVDGWFDGEEAQLYYLAFAGIIAPSTETCAPTMIFRMSPLMWQRAK